MGTMKNYKMLNLKDPYYNTFLIGGMVVTVLQKHGRKQKSYKLLYAILQNIKKVFKREPLYFFLCFGYRLTFGYRIRRKKVRKQSFDVPVPIENVRVAVNNAFKLLFVIAYFKRRREKRSLKQKVLVELYSSLMPGHSLTVHYLNTILRDIKYNKNYKSYKWRRRR